MGRRNLSRAAALVALALPPAAAATGGSAATIHWRTLADGPASGSPASVLRAYVAESKAATAQFSSRLTAPAAATLARVDFSKDALIAIFGALGCRDSSIVVSSIVARGSSFAVRLAERNLPGRAQCMAIYATYRLLLVAKAQLARPYPTQASVSLA